MPIFRLLRDKWNSHLRGYKKRSWTPETYPDHLRRCGAQVGTGCWIAAFDMEVGIEAYLLKIGDFVQIGRDVSAITHDGAAWVFRHLVPDLQVYGPIVIEDHACIGRGAILCPGIHIGRNAIVAPRSLVICDVDPGICVQGVPARAASKTIRPDPHG